MHGDLPEFWLRTVNRISGKRGGKQAGTQVQVRRQACKPAWGSCCHMRCRKSGQGDNP